MPYWMANLTPGFGGRKRAVAIEVCAMVRVGGIAGYALGAFEARKRDSWADRPERARKAGERILRKMRLIFSWCATLSLLPAAWPSLLKRLYHQLRSIVVSSFGMSFQVLADNMKVLGHYRTFRLTPFGACPFKILTDELRIHNPGNIERKHRCVHHGF